MYPLLLLHGAIGSGHQLQPLADGLGFETCLIPNLPGHGGSPYPQDGFSIAGFAEEVLAMLDRKGWERVNIFGYSMGGYIGMYLAKYHPERVHKVITLATKFHWDEAVAAKEVQMLDAEKIETKVPAFATTLRERHMPNDWKEVLSRTGQMLKDLGANNALKPGDYATIQIPVLILLGDRDKMVTLEETVAIYKELPNAQMGIVPATHHPVEQANLPALGFLVRQFLG